MKIKYKKGDVTQATEYVIAHGCNAQGKMNSGVAKSIRAKFPGCFESYAEHIHRGNITGTTDIFIANYNPLANVMEIESNEKMILNMITQLYYGRDGQQYVDYDAIRKCLAFANKRVPMYTSPPHAMAMPMIGAGLGGGDWTVIEQIILEECQDIQPVVYVQ